MTENLNDTGARPVVRIGDTVRRLAYWWTPAVHRLLGHLQAVGFEYAPRVLGFDDEGREVLTYIEGESGAKGWAKIVSDDGLRRFARLLKSYHTAVAGYQPRGNSEWAYAAGIPGPGEILCHGDFGPWNVVWRAEEPVAILDWDFVVPATPRHDVLYALEYSVPFADDEECLKWRRFAEPPDRRRRIEIFAEAYGLAEVGPVVNDVAAMQRTVAGYTRHLAERGLQPQADWVANGALDAQEQKARWTEANRRLFEVK